MSVWTKASKLLNAGLRANVDLLVIALAPTSEHAMWSIGLLLIVNCSAEEVTVCNPPELPLTTVSVEMSVVMLSDGRNGALTGITLDWNEPVAPAAIVWLPLGMCKPVNDDVTNDEMEESEESMGGMEEAKMAAAEEVMGALKSGDKSAFAGALENFMKACSYED